MTSMMEKTLIELKIKTKVVGSGAKQAVDKFIKEKWIPAWKARHMSKGTTGAMVLLASDNGYEDVMKSLQHDHFPTVLIYKSSVGQKLYKLPFTGKSDLDSILSAYKNHVGAQERVHLPIYQPRGAWGGGPPGGAGPSHGRNPMVPLRPRLSQKKYTPAGYGTNHRHKLSELLPLSYQVRSLSSPLSEPPEINLLEAVTAVIKMCGSKLFEKKISEREEYKRPGYGYCDPLTVTVPFGSKAARQHNASLKVAKDGR